MDEKDFMNQTVSEMSIEELEKAIRIKQEPSFPKELYEYPERFERLRFDGWKTVTHSDGVCYDKSIKVLNANWNNGLMNDNVFYVEFENLYKEIIRRK